MKQNWAKRHLFSLLLLLALAITLFGWWRSSREWAAWTAETPVGVFQVASEASLFVITSKIMMHEHRWAVWSDADPVWGDKMQFLRQWPILEYSQNALSLAIPYWQLALFCLVAGMVVFRFEKRRSYS